MITGFVTPHQQAVVQLTVRHGCGREEAIEFVIDTGFTGFLTLPSDKVNALGLNYLSAAFATLGDGTNVPFSTYEAVVLWRGQARDVVVVAAEGGNLMGMDMLGDSRLCIDVQVGGAVTIEPIP